MELEEGSGDAKVSAIKERDEHGTSVRCGKRISRKEKLKIRAEDGEKRRQALAMSLGWNSTQAEELLFSVYCLRSTKGRKDMGSDGLLPGLRNKETEKRWTRLPQWW